MASAHGLLANTQSSQFFVRALKASSDPPQPEGPYKIEIARETWDNASFRVPNKGEVIVDWLLAKLLKDKAKELSNPILDPRYWALLAEIISPSNPQAHVPKSRPPKTWLTPLLNRIPIVPVVLAFVSLLPTLPKAERLSLTPVVQRCLAIIWPLGVRKVMPDTLLECFGGVLKLFKEDNDIIGDDSLKKIGEMLTASFMSVFGNAANKKKTHQTFVQTHLLNWLECTRYLCSSPPSYQDLLLSIHISGTDILFSLDILRHLQTQSTGTPISALPTNFQTLLPAYPSEVLFSLSRLFASFIQTLRKHRGALFSASSGNTLGGTSTEVEVRKAAMAFFVSCMVLVDQAGDSDGAMVWETRVDLLEIVHKETLIRSSIEVRMACDVQVALMKNRDIAIEAVASASRDGKMRLIRLPIVVLSTLTVIDFDLIEPSVLQILRALLLVADCAEAFAFLGLLLDYHTKGRSMHTYLFVMLSAISSSSSLLDPRHTYATSFSSSVFSLEHLERLSKSTLNFLTPGQTKDTMTSTIDTLKRTWDVFWEVQQKVIADSGKGPRKKRKITARLLSGKADDPDVLAASFALTARMSSIVLSSLPLQSLPVSTRSEVQQTLADARSSFIRLGLQQTTEMIKDNLADSKEDGWACQVGAAALLRLDYTLTAARPLGLRAETDEKMCPMMLDVARDERALPELSLEIFHSLLSSSTVVDIDETRSHKVLETLLFYLEQYPAATSWSGLSCHLTFGKSGQEQAALALIHLLVDRWLPAVDCLASRQHLDRITRLMIAMKSDYSQMLSSTEVHRPSTILYQTLRSAQFWELANMRNALLFWIDDETSALDNMNPIETQSLPATKKPPIDEPQLRRVISTYELLLYVPVEYFPRASRQQLIRRAWTTDFVLCQTVYEDADSQADAMRSMTILREISKRWFSFQSSMDHVDLQVIPLYVGHLVTSLHGFTGPTSEFLSATLDLVDLHILVLLRSSEKAAAKAILDIISYFSSTVSTKSSAIEPSGAHTVLLSIVRFLELVTTKFSASAFPDIILSSMKSLRKVLFEEICPRMSILVSGGSTIDGMLCKSDSLQLWCNVLSFGRWLRIEDSVPRFGKRLVAKIVSANLSFPTSAVDPRVEELCCGTLAILLDEFHDCFGSGRLSHLDVVIAAYLCFCRISGFNGWRKFDYHISRTCKALPVSDFAHVLDLCWESLSADGLSPKDLPSLVHLSTILLHEAPQGTLKVIQDFTTHSLNLFASHPMFHSGPLFLRLRVLDCTAQHCSDRPAALRSQDLNSVWSLLSKLLSGSEQHDATTSTAIFHNIIIIISSIIRLRRDLVVFTLPHLGMVLRQLITVLRHLRPQLGAKQSKLVTDTLPMWINAFQPLAAEDGKALARLLTTLTSKTIVRTNQSSSTDNQKAESLAKPFSKHAAYVLKAYLDTMNDPLCVMPLDVRKALYPGLFSLCDMISEHSRDALMVSALDASGKVTMKALWKEYEKQRYVGKG